MGCALQARSPQPCQTRRGCVAPAAARPEATHRQQRIVGRGLKQRAPVRQQRHARAPARRGHARPVRRRGCGQVHGRRAAAAAAVAAARRRARARARRPLRRAVDNEREDNVDRGAARPARAFPSARSRRARLQQRAPLRCKLVLRLLVALPRRRQRRSPAWHWGAAVDGTRGACGAPPPAICTRPAPEQWAAQAEQSDSRTG